MSGSGGCGRCHPAIELPAAHFPDDLPWQEVVVLPLGALHGPAGAQWHELLVKHAQQNKEPQQPQRLQRATKAAAAGQPDGEMCATAAKQAAAAESRVWDGYWTCACGVVSKRVSCTNCKQLAPCK